MANKQTFKLHIEVTKAKIHGGLFDHLPISSFYLSVAACSASFKKKKDNLSVQNVI